MNVHLRKLSGGLDILFPLLALLLGLLTTLLITPSVQQAVSPVPMPQSFHGEYSWDRVNWYPLEDDSDLSAFHGDLYLRGYLERPFPANTRLYYYDNHIAVELYVNGERRQTDILMELERYGMDIQPAMCSRSWEYWYFNEPYETDTLIEIHLKNPHRYGNESAYREFLSTFSCTVDNPDYLANVLVQYSRSYMVMGVILAIVALMLLGSALAAFALRTRVAIPLTKLGLLAGFSGGFFIFDILDLSIISDNNLLNSYGWQICMMYSVYLLGVMAKDAMTGRQEKIAGISLGVSAMINAVIIICSFAGAVLIYDTLFFWTVSQLLLCPVLIVCSALEIRSGKNKNRYTLLFLILLFLCVVLDLFGFFNQMYSKANLTKTVFCLFFVYVFLRSTAGIIRDHNASIRAQKLEEELEESRISVMLSQIQPHFMFNVLGTLRGLCREDPEQAWKGLGDFSTYLRGNMNALTNTKFIPFDNELRHVETYLRLEKMRLGEKLSIVYDIQDRNFEIPPLTLQPLVENAVKHGIFYKQSGGTVIVQSRRESDKILITVRDNGVGFDAKNPKPEFENHAHVGLANVRKRVEIMLGGSLTIDSVLQEGTMVVVEFPVSGNMSKGV